MEERTKQKRKECLERIISEKGTQLRMNRSIQAEGSFGDIKGDMGFRRYLSQYRMIGRDLICSNSKKHKF